MHPKFVFAGDLGFIARHLPITLAGVRQGWVRTGVTPHLLMDNDKIPINQGAFRRNTVRRMPAAFCRWTYLTKVRPWRGPHLN